MTKNGASVGRKPVEYVERAIALVLDQSSPISTNEIVAKLKLKPNQRISMRRGLKRAEEDGRIRKVSRAPDDSFAWLPTTVPVTRCAAHAANMYLSGAETGLQIDPEEFEAWVEDQGKESDLREVNNEASI